MKTILGVIFLVYFNAGFSQQGLENQIKQFYLDVNNGDADKTKSHFLATASVSTIKKDTVIHYSVMEFLKLCLDFKSKKIEKKVSRVEFIEENIKRLRYLVYYELFLDGKFKQTYIDEMTFIADNNYVYKIDKIYTSTFVNSDKMENFETDKSYVKYFLNKWHEDVANSNLEAYFNFMHPNFIFLGTDPGERWTKNQFYNFCKPYFDKHSTWDFKVNWRNIYQSKGVIWFEESLNTWMEECRGSGVLVYENSEWKLIHYNLTVLIENEKVDKFIKLRKK